MVHLVLLMILILNCGLSSTFGPVSLRYESYNGSNYLLVNTFFNSSLPIINNINWSFNGTAPIFSINGDHYASFSSDLGIGGYATMGVGGPSVKMKTFTTSTNGSEGGIAELTHGLVSGKINHIGRSIGRSK